MPYTRLNGQPYAQFADGRVWRWRLLRFSPASFTNSGQGPVVFPAGATYGLLVVVCVGDVFIFIL